MKRSLTSVAVLSVALASTLTANAQNTGTAGTVDAAGNTVRGTVGAAGNTVGNTVGTVGNTVGNTVGTVGNTAQGVVGSLQPTLQPVTQGVGSALDNLTQPQTVSSLLEFLAGVIPNHIEAHVNLDSLRVDKLTVDVRGVDLRNLRVDLLVANSRNGGTVRPALPSAGSRSQATGAPGTGTIGGVNYGTTNGAVNNRSTVLPGDVPIAGSSERR